MNKISGKFLSTFIFFFCFIFSTFAENNIVVSGNVKLYKEKNIVITHYKNTMRFEIDPVNQCIKAGQNISYSFLSLLPYQIATTAELYDEYNIITSYSGVSEQQMICGNFQPEGIFHSDLKKCQFELYLKEPFKESELSVDKRIYDSRLMLNYLLCNDYPIRNATLKFEIPDGIDIDLVEINTDKFIFRKSKIYDPELKLTTYEFLLDSIPGYIHEENAPGELNTYPHILIISNGYTYNKYHQELFSNLDNLYQWAKKMFYTTRNDTTIIKFKVYDLIKGLTTHREKINAIFNWVQDSIRYIAFEEGLAGYIPESVQKIYSSKYSDCKGMANLLKAMLSVAGYDTRITWVGTDDLPYNLRYPVISAFNHVICTVFLGNEKIILDATDKYAGLGEIPTYIQGRRVMIENKDSFIIDSLPVLKTEYSLKTLEYQYKIENENLNGKVKMNFRGDSRKSICSILEDIPTTDHKTLLERIMSQNLPNILVKNVNFPVINNHDSVFTVESDIVVKGKVSEFDNELYIFPEDFENYSALLIPESRLSAFDLKWIFGSKTKVKIYFPDKYAIYQLPKDTEFFSDIAVYKMKFIKEGNSITCTREFRHLIPQVSRDKFDEWNNFIKKIKGTYVQQIILHAKI